MFLLFYLAWYYPLEGSKSCPLRMDRLLLEEGQRITTLNGPQLPFILSKGLWRSSLWLNHVLTPSALEMHPPPRSLPTFLCPLGLLAITFQLICGLPDVPNDRTGR